MGHLKKIHPRTWQYLDPTPTSDGDNVGVVKHLSKKQCLPLAKQMKRNRAKSIKRQRIAEKSQWVNKRR
jgi:DNA-directed RNA polymerase beta subunit